MRDDITNIAIDDYLLDLMPPRSEIFRELEKRAHEDAIDMRAANLALVEGQKSLELLSQRLFDAQEAERRIVARDPSFINWQIIGTCGQWQIVPDFPLINKSFNLSYTGNDL